MLSLYRRYGGRLTFLLALAGTLLTIFLSEAIHTLLTDLGWLTGNQHILVTSVTAMALVFFGQIALNRLVLKRSFSEYVNAATTWASHNQASLDNFEAIAGQLAQVRQYNDVLGSHLADVARITETAAFDIASRLDHISQESQRLADEVRASVAHSDALSHQSEGLYAN